MYNEWTFDFINEHEIWVNFEVRADIQKCIHAYRQTHQYHESAWPRGRVEWKLSSVLYFSTRNLIPNSTRNLIPNRNDMNIFSLFFPSAAICNLRRELLRQAVFTKTQLRKGFQKNNGGKCDHFSSWPPPPSP